MRGQEAAYGPSSVDKALGALPVVAEFSRRLDLVGIIDRACPVRDVAILSHGQVVEALVANRLTSPAPMWRVAEWAQEWAVEAALGITGSALNDDRIARGVGRGRAGAGPHRGVGGCAGDRRVRAGRVPAAPGHDLGVAVRGPRPDRPRPPGATVRPPQGPPPGPQADPDRAGGHRGRGGAGVPPRLPWWGREVSQVSAAMRACRDLAGPRRFLLVGDSKLVSYANLCDMVAAEVEFIAPASKTYVRAAELAGIDRATATEVDYTAGRDADVPAAARGTWAVLEDTMTITGKRKKDPVLRLRRVFVHSGARAHAAATARAKKLDRARDDLGRLGRGLGSRHYPDEATVTARAAAITRDRRVGPYLRTDIGTDPATGKPTLDWSYDQAALDTEAATDGWYALLTNLPADTDAAEVLRRYKGQEAVERRYGTFTGPLAVAPMFLHNNRLIAALTTVICLALLVYSLIERQVRRAIAPATTLDGLGAGHRPAKPTARLVLGALARLRLTPARNGRPATIPRPTPLQSRLLELLDIDPTRGP